MVILTSQIFTKNKRWEKLERFKDLKDLNVVLNGIVLNDPRILCLLSASQKDKVQRHLVETGKRRKITVYTWAITDQTRPCLSLISLINRELENIVFIAF